MTRLLSLIGFREELPLDYSPLAPDSRISSDDERATELALRQSIGLAQYYNKVGQRRPMDRVFSQATWLRKLDLMRWQAQYRRRHPHTPITPTAA